MWGSATRRGCVLQDVLQRAENLGDKDAVQKEEMEERLAQFVDHWEKLKELVEVR